jgi:hypothetical protein
MRQLVPLLAALAFVGCTAQVVGPHSGSLSQQDVQQIQSLVSARSDIHFKTIVYIHAIRPSRVYVEAADSMVGALIRSRFTVNKRAGQWSIDTHSIQNYAEVLVTE